MQLPSMETILQKVASLKQQNHIDLSTEEDLAIAVMNLISLEEHFFFSGEKTQKPAYFELMSQIRTTRKELLAKLMDVNEGETWCISKHLLATTMRLMEVGTKLQADKKVEEAKKMFDRAYQMFSLFWGLRLKLINIKDLHHAAREDQPWTLQDIMTKLVDCCDEK